MSPEDRALASYAPPVKDTESLDRALWTDADFEAMGWHDATVHAIGFDQDEESARLLFDIDYIVRWIDPVPPSEYYSFLIAPATLVFENVWNVEAEVTTQNAGERTLLVVADLDRGEPQNEWERNLGLRQWTIHGHN